ncbi:MAG TPA: multidrug efflux RND transporter permease subunit [Thermoguttaceae bacterium]|nr:multidrug efflux RND transporter permease subunit [Thermoguttaceae bacterium]
MISRFFIHRPIFASVISIVILIAGVVSQRGLPVSKFPEITPPTVQVTAFYPGANAQVVSETVAAPIEQEVNGVEDMLYMSSNSADDGSYTLNVTFEIGTDMDMATVLVQNRVAIATSKLPEEVRRQGVTTKKQSTQIIQFVVLISPDGSYDDLYLSNYATINIKDELSRIRGVGSVTVMGAEAYSMRVWLDPRKLKARNLTTEDVVAAIGEQNVQVAAGRIGEPPAPEGTAFQLVVNTLGRLREQEEFENLIIKTAEGGRITRVKDVARVELGAKSYNRQSTFNGQPSTAIAIYQLPGANALDLAAQVRAKMDELKGRFPEGLDYEVPYDTTRFVEASIDEVYATLYIAVFLVVVVIYVFLQDWRATVIPCAAIPVSLVGTFAAMACLGFSINMLTLFGIILAIGIVVDDAIVVVENTSRHLEAGLGPKDAAIKAMQEITGPVIATTLVLLAVFVPTAFMAGITGQLYRQFALTISAAVLISTINALTLSPALCGLLLRPPRETRFAPFRWFNESLRMATSGYTFVVRSMVRRVAIVMIVFAGMVVLTGWGFTKVPTGFLPTEDQGYCFANVQLPDAASLNRTVAVMRQLDEIMENTPGVADWVSVAGYSILSGTNGSNLGLMAIVFEPWEARQEPHLSQDAIVAHLRAEFAKIEEAIVIAFVPPPIDGLGNAGGFQMQLQDRGGAGLGQLEDDATLLVEQGNQQPGLTALSTTFRARVPQLFVDVDRTKVKTLDVPLSSVFNTLQAYLGSAYVNDFNQFGRTWQVRVQADHPFRVQADDIRQLDVRNHRGDMVPIGTVVDVEETLGPQVVQRYNLYPSAQVNGEPAPGFSSGQALSLMEQTVKAELPSMSYEWTGMSYQEKQVSGEQYVIFLLAVVFVFLVLAAQYESWTSPAAVIAVVPLAALGVVIALAIRGSDNNVYTQIGVVLLVALASKNAILIVEFARDERRQGKSISEAAADAARLRFRAILMTAFSSILGFMPLLVSSGAGAASRQAVGTAVVGGMIAATFFAVLLVPSFFVVFQNLSEIRTRFGASPAVRSVDESIPPDHSDAPEPTT